MEPAKSNPVDIPKKVGTFKKYYDDPVFRAKHKAQCLEKVVCECGRSVARVAMYNHVTTQIHRERLAMKKEKEEAIKKNEEERKIKEEKLIQILKEKIQELNLDDLFN